MAKINKQRDRFEKYSVLLLRFCNASVLSSEITKFFGDKIVKELIEQDVFVLRDFLALDKNKARSLFKNSDIFREAVNALGKLCEKEILTVFNQYRVGKAYLLIAPFDELNKLIKWIGNRAIDYKYTDFSGVKTSLDSIGIFTYLDLSNAGIIKVGSIKGFGEKGYHELSNIINGEKRRVETGEIVHTKKWTKTDKQKGATNQPTTSTDFNIKLVKQDPKVKQVHVNAVKRLYNHLTKLIEAKETTFLNKKLKEAGVSPYCYNYAYKVGLNNLNDIYRSLNIIVKKYGYVQSRLTNLADNVAKISMAKLKSKTTKAKKVTVKKKTVTKAKKPKKSSITSGLLRKFYNFYGAKRYPMDYFEKEIGPYVGGMIPGAQHHTIIPVKLKSGFVFNAYSKEERSFLRKLDKEKYITEIKGGNFGIEVRIGGELQYTYYPDVYIQTKDGKIGFIEIKPLYDMCDKDVLDKWETLKQFCDDNGYICFIGNQAFSSYPELSKRKTPQELISAIRKCIREKGEFDYKDYRKYKTTSTIKGRDLDVALSAYCYTRRYTYEISKYGFRQFGITKE